MDSSRICTAGLLISALWIGGALAGEHLEAQRIKTCTPDGVCFPSRQTYGYHPTQWRRWPGAEIAAAAKIEQPTKAPEPVPPPRQPPSQDTQPGGDLPGDILNDDMPLPGEDSDTMPPPPGESGPVDAQPAVPRDLQKNLPQPPLDEDLRNILEDETPPARPKSSRATEPDEESTPEMHGDEGDPFKDEPIPGDPDNESGKRPSPQSPPNQRADNMRWRTAPALAVKAAVNESESPEPLLLQSTAAGRPGTHRSPASALVNPLRAAAAAVKPKPRPQKVLPTAEWSAQAQDSAAASLWHNNPLRAR